MGPRSPEGMAARKIIASLDSISLQENVLAYLLANGNDHIQKKLFNLVMHLIRIWAARYDGNNFNEDNMEMHVNAKRMQECLERFGYVFTSND